MIAKFKGHFCAHGDQQVKGIHYFETYAPVVQCTTVRLMLILEMPLDLKFKQGDVTAAFFMLMLAKMKISMFGCHMDSGRRDKS